MAQNKSSEKFFCKIFRENGEVLLAVADEDIIGKKFSEKEVEIEVKESFYGGKKANKKEIKNLFREASIINLVGRKIFQFFVEQGFLDEKNVLKIGDVPHAQIVKI